MVNLSLKALRIWAEGKPPATVVGKAGKSCYCPIATYLKEQGLIAPQVHDGYNISYQNPRRKVRTHLRPPNRRRLLTVTRLVDRNGYDQDVTREEFLEVLHRAARKVEL